MTDVSTTGLGAAFWRLWTSSALSNLADGIVKVSLPLVALRFTSSPTLIGGLAFAVTLPWLFFALPAGALADRLDRRRLMLGANAVRALTLGVLAAAFAAGVGSIWVLYAVALCLGTAETLYDTAAQSILPQVVPRDRLSRANGRLIGAEITANEFVGPPLGGFLVLAGAVTAFATPAGLWAVAIGALLLVPGPYRVDRVGRSTLRADVAEGLRFLWRHRLLRTLAGMVGTFNFASNAAWAVLVLYAVGPKSAVGLSEPAFGALLATSAAGMLAGSLVAERVEARLGRARALLAATIGCALLVAGPALTSNAVLIGTAFFVSGTCSAVWNVITVSLRQRVTPDRLLGRLNSGYRLVAWGSRPLGALAGGLLAQALGVRAVFVVMTALTLALVPVVTRVTDARMDAAERAASA
ncbi:MAG: MFS transporter [Mycobacteriales bacterium]